MDGSSSRGRWETFTSSDTSSSSSYSTGATEGFESVATSSAMTKFSPASTKTKLASGTMWYLCSEGVNAFI